MKTVVNALIALSVVLGGCRDRHACPLRTRARAARTEGAGRRRLELGAGEISAGRQPHPHVDLDLGRVVPRLNRRRGHHHARVRPLPELRRYRPGRIASVQQRPLADQLKVDRADQLLALGLGLRQRGGRLVARCSCSSPTSRCRRAAPRSRRSWPADRTGSPGTAARRGSRRRAPSRTGPRARTCGSLRASAKAPRCALRAARSPCADRYRR